MKPANAATASSRLGLREATGQAWRDRSGRLFAEFERPARAMVRRAYRGAFTNEEIDDIYASAWVGTLRALATRHEGLTDDEVRSYVLTAVANQAGKELRRRRRKPTAPLELVGGVPDASEGPAERVAGAEQSRVTRDLLASLPPRRRAVILLRYGWGLEPRQVCSMLTGLSPRAYRKEITRGVDELTEKMRAFERGEWCADREPILKAFVAGLADADQRRQAQAHLAHCRECSGFVAGLSRRLYDVGAALSVPAAIEGLRGHATLADRFADLGQRGREAVSGIFTRGGAEETSAQAAAVGGTRGAGAAGAGIFAKIAGLGAAGKLAFACVGGGVVATACVAAGVGPLSGGQSGDKPPPRVSLTDRSKIRDEVVATPAPTVPPSAVGAESALSPGDAVAHPQSRSQTTPSVSSDPVAPQTPPVEQEFGIESAATATPSATSSAPVTQSDGGGGSAAAVRKEFGP